MAKILDMVRVEVDPEDLRRAQWKLTAYPRGINKALMRALNAALTKMRGTVVKDAALGSAVPQKFIRRRLWLNKAKTNKLYGSVVLSGRAWPLVWFAHSVAPTGVQTIRGLIAHSFVARMKTGHVGIYLRKRKTRLPIFEQTAPSMAETIRALLVAPKISEEGRRTLSKRIRAEVDLILEGRRSGE